MTTTTAPATVEQLQGELDAMLNPLDIPRSWTQRELDAYEAKRRLLNAQIRIVRGANDVLAEVNPEIDALTTQRDDLAAIRAELEKELAELTEPERLAIVTDSKEFEKRHWVTVSIRIIDNQFDLANELIPERGLPLFDKLRERKYVPPTWARWNPMASLFGSLPTIEARLKDLTKRRDEAQHALSSLV